MTQKRFRKGMSVFTAALLMVLPACSQKEPTSSSIVAQTATAETASACTGTVSDIHANSITIRMQDGTARTIPCTEETEFLRSGMEGAETAPEGQPPEAPAEQAPDEGAGAPGNNNQPPEKPDGGEPPAAEGDPAGEPAGQTPPEKPEGDSQPDKLTYTNVKVGDEVTVMLAADGSAATVLLPGSGMGGPGEGTSQPDKYAAANTYTEDTVVSNTELASTGVDENTVYLGTSGANVTLDDVAVGRASVESTGGDASSFYGVGAAALVTDGTLNISNSTINTDAKGGAGVFAYGDGKAYVADSAITTQQDTSGGIHVAGGGTLYAWNLQVQTEGESSAAIRSDRGSGTMVVDGGSYTSNGEGSPAVYSTADITVHDADLTANGSEAICIEGLNTIRLFDCNLSGNMRDLPQNDCTWNVILYQSMSGDSAVGNSTFEMAGGTLTAQNGGMFYTTNTESTFVLSGVTIENAGDSPFLLRCTGNTNQRGWGTAGANGADCHFTGIGQELCGDVIWDSISQLDFYLTQGSRLSGAFIDDESSAGDGGTGYADLYIDADSAWVVTGDSTLNTLACAGELTDADGNPVTVAGADGTTYVAGTSPYTVTVNRYTDTPDFSGASSTDDWQSYAAVRP